MTTLVEPRKKPRQKRSSSTVTFILDASARILEEKGLSAFNTNAVARRAGISIGSLYQFFPSKDAIMATLLLRERERAAQMMRGLLTQVEGKKFDDAYLTLLRGLRAHEPTPHLGQILEMEEQHLPPTAALEAIRDEIDGFNRAFFSRHVNPARCSDAQLDIAAQEITCIVGAMRTRAAKMGDLGSPDLDLRILRTVQGYMAPFLADETANEIKT